MLQMNNNVCEGRSPGEAIDMVLFLPILQRTNKILAMPGRLSTILMANIKFWAHNVSKRQVI